MIAPSTQLALHANNVSLYGQVAANEVMAGTATRSTTSSITAATTRIPTLASQVERTIAANPPPLTLDLKSGKNWVPETYFGCNSKEHKWKEDDVIVCPHHNKPGVQTTPTRIFHSL